MLNSGTPMQNADPGMLLCAFRYSLGRMTYITSECVGWLQTHWDCLPTGWQVQIHDDIRSAIGRDMAGHACDVEGWKKVLLLPIRKEQPDGQ